MPIQIYLRRVTALLTCACALALTACGGGGTTNTGPNNPWAGTYTTQFVLKGDIPDNFLGPDGNDPLIQAQVRQLLNNRTIELGLYSVANSSGYIQQVTLQDAPILSYLSVSEPAFAIPGRVALLGDGAARLELELAAPQFAWQTLALRGGFSATQVNDLVMRIFPSRFNNIVAGETVPVAWEVTGMNGSRLVQVTCTQRMWLYSVPNNIR